MKKSIIILITLHLSLFTLHSSAQGDWYPLYPIPTGNDLADVCFVDELKGWAVGEKGTILHTSDGGETWGFQESGTELRLRSVIFTDLLTGWVVGGNTHPLPGKYIILKTMDGGINWNIQKTDTNSILNTVHFINSTTGWAAGEHGNLFCTNDGGVNWISQWCGSSWNNNNEVFFLDSLNGWIASESGLYATTNGGMIWELKVECWALSVYFLSPNEGWASTFGMGYGSGYVFHTEDAFNSWDTLMACGNYDSSCGYYSIFFKDSLNGWLLHSFCSTGWWTSCGNYLLKTQDGGQNWEAIGIPSSSGFSALSFSPQGKGCIVGSHGKIYTTENWSDSWELSSAGNYSCILSMCFLDNNTGWASGAGQMAFPGFLSGSEMIYTSDGGLNWVEKDVNVPAVLHSVNFTDYTTGWAVGCSYHNWTPDTGYIIKTTDGGDDWSVLRMDSSYAYRDIYFIDENNGWAVGYYYVYENTEGRILRTYDGGLNWTQQDCDSCKELYSVHFVDPEHGWSVGRSIYATQDGGQNWIEQYYDTSGFFLYSMYFHNVNEGWIVGNRGSQGIILHTVDRGNNWTTSYFNRALYDIHFKDDIQGLISGNGGTILLTQDGGTTWEELETGTGYYLYSVFYAPNGQGYAAGDWGTIIKSDLLTVSVDEITFNTQHSTLKTQIYPNPSDGIFNVQFKIYDLQSVSLKIYDTHGREVAVVLDEKLPAGEHTIAWNAEGMPTGIYYCRLQAGSQLESGKMILIK